MYLASDFHNYPAEFDRSPRLNKPARPVFRQTLSAGGFSPMASSSSLGDFGRVSPFMFISRLFGSDTGSSPVAPSPYTMIGESREDSETFLETGFVSEATIKDGYLLIEMAIIADFEDNGHGHVIALFDTCTGLTHLKSRYMLNDFDSIFISSKKEGDVQTGTYTSSFSLASWKEQVIIGSNPHGLGLLAASLNSPFTKTAGQFSINHLGQLYIGDYARFTRIDPVIHLVSQLGIERGEWIVEQGNMVLGGNDIIDVSVRINTSVRFAVSQAVLAKIIYTLSGFTTMHMDMDQETGEYDQLSVDPLQISNLPTIVFNLPGNVEFKLAPFDYCDHETGSIVIPLNEFEEELVVDVGLAVLQDVTIHFHTESKTIGFTEELRSHDE